MCAAIFTGLCGITSWHSVIFMAALISTYYALPPGVAENVDAQGELSSSSASTGITATTELQSTAHSSVTSTTSGHVTTETSVLSTASTHTSSSPSSTSRTSPSLTTEHVTTAAMSIFTTACPSKSGFSASSFIGGIILGVGMMIIAYVVYRCFVSRHVDTPYHQF